MFYLCIEGLIFFKEKGPTSSVLCLTSSHEVLFFFINDLRKVMDSPFLGCLVACLQCHL